MSRVSFMRALIWPGGADSKRVKATPAGGHDVAPGGIGVLDFEHDGAAEAAGAHEEHRVLGDGAGGPRLS